jgi:Abnormal spindle-like microcephaly-assoc'd, ASPM-SPD-2-Hydin
MNRRVAGGSFAVFLGAGTLFFLVQAAAFPQTVTKFTSVQAWQTAVQGSPQFAEGFQEFNRDTYFQTGVLNVGPFSLQQVGHDPTFGNFQNFIDLPPLQFTDNSGVANAALYTKFGVVTVDMKFSLPVFAWGANFYGAESGELENLVVTGLHGNLIATIPVTVDTGFFGFVISPSEEISDITFESRLDNPDPTVGQGVGLGNVVGALTGTASVVFNPSPINFGDVTVWTRSPKIPVVVTNYTDSTASYESSTSLREFHFFGGICGKISPETTLAAGASCTFDVQFLPRRLGTANGSITFSTSGGPVDLPLSGTSIGPLIFSPPFLDFGRVEVGTKSWTIPVTVSNDTGSPVTYLSSTGLSEFQFQGKSCGAINSGTTLAPGASCTFGVDFAPTTQGALNGIITISTSAGPVTYHMSGTGAPAR